MIANRTCQFARMRCSAKIIKFGLQSEFCIFLIRSFLFLLIISGCTSCSHHEEKTLRQSDVKQFLSLLSSEERFVLDHFFRCLIQEDSIGYVLLGGKPMSFYSYLKPKTIVNPYQCDPLQRLDLLFEGFDDKDALFHKGWEIWKKYEHYFCGKNIFFDAFEEDRELHFMKVIVVNKNLMLPLLDRYFHKFTSMDSSLRDKESVFEALLHNRKFKEKFYSRNDLLGTCLGYGAKNAALFQKMSKLFTSMGRLGFTLQMPSPDRLKSLEEEWSILRKSFTGGFKDHTSRKFLFHFGVGFRVDFSDPETCLLRKKYTDYHKKVTLAYDGTDFLEKTLELISLANNS